jgi:phage/conjugal plasmid C-4 type zinc finger TraR family protein
MDDADRAAEYQERLNAEAVKAHRLSQSSDRHPTHCVDCGREIQPVRRLAVPGCTRCVMCQMDADRREAWGI